MSDFFWGTHDTQKALKAGLDIEMPDAKHYNYRKIRKCLKKDLLCVKHIDRSVARILRALILQTPKIQPEKKSVIGSGEHCALAREVAEKGIVLLENSGLLPLTKNARLAVIGPYADTVNVGDRGSSRVKSKYNITPFQGLAKAFKGASLYNGTDIAKALDSSKGSDTAVVCVGYDYKTEGEFIINSGKNIKKKPKNKPRQPSSIAKKLVFQPEPFL